MELVYAKIPNARLLILEQQMTFKLRSTESMEKNTMDLRVKLRHGNGLLIYLLSVLEISIFLLLISTMTLSQISAHSEDIIGEELTAINSMQRFIQEERKENL